MTREDLAKDILLTLLPNWARDIEPSCPDPIQRLPETSVALADALLEALGAKEAPASWLSKEMRTPAKGFPAIKDHHVDFDGVKVSLYRREPGDGVNPATMPLEPVKPWMPGDGDIVRVRTDFKDWTHLKHQYAGKVGKVTEAHTDTTLCYVAFDTSWGRFWANELEPAE